jgi:IS5 family transposase
LPDHGDLAASAHADGVELRLHSILPYQPLTAAAGLRQPRAATDAAAYEGRCLRQGLLDKTNTAGGVWADIAYRSAANETFLNKNGFVSHIHRKKPKGRATPETMRRANKAKSKIRSRVEHVFAEQKDRMGLFIRTIGIARATAKIGMANLVYNINALSSCARSPSHDRLVLSKATHSTHYRSG